MLASNPLASRSTVNSARFYESGYRCCGIGGLRICIGGIELRLLGIKRIGSLEAAGENLHLGPFLGVFPSRKQ